MKKKIILNVLISFPIGIAIGQIITIVISLIYGGKYYSCPPQLISDVGSEMGAVVLQTILCGIVGAGLGGTNVVWQVQKWSIFRQTAVYFAVACLIMLPVAYFMRWMEHSFAGFLIYFGIFVFIFIVFWGISYLINKRLAEKMNKKLNEKKKEMM